MPITPRGADGSPIGPLTESGKVNSEAACPVILNFGSESIPGAFAAPVELAHLAAVPRLRDVVDVFVGLGPLAVLGHEP